MSFPGMTDFSCVRSRAIGCHLVSSSISHVFLSCRFPVVVQNLFRIPLFLLLCGYLGVCMQFISICSTSDILDPPKSSFLWLDSVCCCVLAFSILAVSAMQLPGRHVTNIQVFFSFSRVCSSRVIPKLYPPVEHDGILFCGWTRYLGGAYLGALLSWAMDQDCLWWRWNVGGLPKSCMS